MARLNTRLLYNRAQLPADTLVNSDGKCVLYVMSRDQRIVDNFAMQAAQQYALERKLPFAVVFTILPQVANRAREHFDFMMSGLFELENKLSKLNIPLIALFGSHEETIANIAHHTKPALIFTDFSPLQWTIAWQNILQQTLPLIVVDSHNVVPVWEASSKQEFSARTIRPKIHKQLHDYLQSAADLRMHPYLWPGTVLSLSELSDKIAETRANYRPNNTAISSVPGEEASLDLLDAFVSQKLHGYGQKRNDPTMSGLSDLSPYLHFGQVASVTVAKRVLAESHKDPSLIDDANVLIEEIIVRKELSDNFCYYNKNHQSLQSAPEWALNTLSKHAADPREYVYNLDDFEDANTHDAAWNAAQMQLRKTGKIHGYMRMYWAKKVLEWSESPEKAHEILLYLNDFYSIDGGDPNGYVGILWSIAGLHDRPWGERPVYGTIRSMVYNGLKRKFAISEYEKVWLS